MFVGQSPQSGQEIFRGNPDPSFTLDWLDKQQIEYQNHNLERFTVKGGQAYRPFDLPVPADFSSATFSGS